jgi:transposase
VAEVSTIGLDIAKQTFQAHGADASGRVRPAWRVVLDILVQDRRNATAAKRFFKRLLQNLQ